MIEITSSKNQKFKEIIKFINKNGKTSKNEILIEGMREIERANKAGIIFNEIYFCEDFIKSEIEKKFLDDIKKQDIPQFRLNRDLYSKIAYKNNPFGILVKAEFLPQKIEDISVEENAFILIAESIEKPGNLGALVRTADGAGVDTVILSNKLTDFRNPNSLRASTGTIFSTNMVEGDSLTVIETLKSNGVKIVAADPYGEQEYTGIDYTNKIAVVVGSEDKGLSSLYKERADYLVKIPMKGFADSLNVNQAATIILYEALRQRNL